jgi:hypothetical protein
MFTCCNPKETRRSCGTIKLIVTHFERDFFGDNIESFVTMITLKTDETCRNFFPSKHRWNWNEKFLDHRNFPAVFLRLLSIRSVLFLPFGAYVTRRVVTKIFSEKKSARSSVARGLHNVKLLSEFRRRFFLVGIDDQLSRDVLRVLWKRKTVDLNKSIRESQ